MGFPRNARAVARHLPARPSRSMDRGKRAHEHLCCGTVFRPFPIIAEAPYFGDGESSRRSECAAGTPAGPQAEARARSGQAFEEGPRQPTRAKASRPDRRRWNRRSPTCSIPASARAPRGRARRPACSRRRTIRSTAAPISPPRTGRASRPQDLTRRRSRTTPARDRPRGPAPAGVDTELAEALGSRGRRRGRCRRRGQERHHDVPRHHRRHRHRAGAGDAAARGPPGIQRAAVDAAPPAAPGEIRRRPAAGDQVGLRAQGRPAAGDRRPGRGREAPGPHPGAARRHRLRQDLHHGQGDRGDAAAGARARAQQDAGGAALRRVQELLPGQRGRVFRQLLRLLPARGLRAAHRHLYREGILDQRADRPHAPHGDARAARARRRHHRGLGVVHLRHRLGRDLFGDDVHAQAGRAHRPAPADRRSRGAAVQAQRRRLLPRLVPRARRRDRDLSRSLRGPRLAGAAVRRRDRIRSTNSIRSPGRRPTSSSS